MTISPAPYNFNPKPGSDAFARRVKWLLLDGYGVDDIAIKLGCNPAGVRIQVSAFRTAGKLAEWWKK